MQKFINDDGYDPPNKWFDFYKKSYFILSRDNEENYIFDARKRGKDIEFTIENK